MFKQVSTIISIFLASFLSLMVQSEIYPPEEWAKRATTSNISVSPDGNRIAMLRINGVGENPILEIYNSNDLSARPFRMDADPMEMTGLSWITDQHVLFYARQNLPFVAPEKFWKMYPEREVRAKRLPQGGGPHREVAQHARLPQGGVATK